MPLTNEQLEIRNEQKIFFCNVHKYDSGHIKDSNRNIDEYQQK